jgi:hypothetical protein
MTRATPHIAAQMALLLLLVCMVVATPIVASAQDNGEWLTDCD